MSAILVVDDEPMVLRLMVGTPSEAAFRYAAPDALRALELAPGCHAARRPRNRPQDGAGGWRSVVRVVRGNCLTSPAEGRESAGSQEYGKQTVAAHPMSTPAYRQPEG